MTNGTAAFLALVAAAAIAADGVYNGWAASLFLSRRFLDLISLVAFWR
jgi:hypothetical protein